MNLERDLHKTFISSETPLFPANLDKETLKERFAGFSEFMMMYSSAIKEVRTKFEVLNVVEHVGKDAASELYKVVQ